MSEVADTIPELTTIVPLPVAGVFVSRTVYLGEYSSLSTIIYSDEFWDLAYEFSGDGFNFDYVDQVNGVPLVTTRKSLVIVAKYLRIRVTNIGVGPMTELRCFTYGSVDNTALDAIVDGLLNVNIVSPLPLPVDIVNPLPLPVAVVSLLPNPLPVIVSNSSPISGVVDIRSPLTLVDDVKISELTAVIQYMFTKGEAGFISPPPGDWHYPYSDLKAVEVLSIPGQKNSIIEQFGGFARLEICLSLVPTPSTSVPGYIVMTGRSISCNPGQPILCRFQSYFVQGARGIGSLQFPTLMGCGMGFLTPGGAIENFVGFGYGNPNAAFASAPFCIVLYVGGTRTFISQSSWNIDTADGLGPKLPNMVTWGFKNSFEISIVENRILFKVLSPVDGVYYPVHQIISSNNNRIALFSDFNMGFLAFQEYATYVGGTIYPTVSYGDILGVAMFMLGIQSDFTQVYDRFSYVEMNPTVMSNAFEEMYVLGIIHSGTLNGQNCYTSINLDLFTAIVGPAGNCIYRIYRNRAVSTVTAVADIADNLTFIPIQSIAYANPVTVSLPGIMILSVLCSNLGAIHMDLTPYNIWLRNGDSITVTVTQFESASQGAVASLGYSAGISNQ